MAQETELERLVVRIVGDSSSLTQSYQQVQQATGQAASSIQAKSKDMEGGLQGVDLSVRDLRKSLMLMSAAGVVSPEAGHSLFLLAEGGRLAKESIGGVVASMGMLKGALVATGIGALVVGIGAAVGWLSKMAEEASRAREAAKSAFQSMVTGSRTASQAMADVRVNVLTEGMQDLADVVNPGFWRSMWNGLQGIVGLDPVTRRIDDVVERARAAQTALENLQSDPRLRQLGQEIAVRRNVQQARDSALVLGEEAERAGMAERAAERYAAAQRLAREGSISLTEALRRLGPAFDSVEESRRRIDVGRLQLQLRELNDEADRAGLTDLNKRLASMAQEFLRANPAVGSLENAFAQLRPIIDGTRESLNRISLANFTRDIRLQGATMGLSSERAQLFKMAMDGVSEANLQAALAEVKHLEALRALQQPLEKIEGTRAGSLEALHRLADYQRGLEQASRAGSARQQILANQQTGMPVPQISGVLAGGAGGVAAQQQALTVGQLQQNILPGSLLTGGASSSGAVGGTARIESILQNILDLLRRGSQASSANTQVLVPVGS